MERSRQPEGDGPLSRRPVRRARAVFPRACESVHKDETDIPETYKVLIFWALGFELARYPAMSDLALAAFEASLADPYSSFQFRMLRATGRVPARELVPLALRTGRRDEARRALLGCASSSWSATGYAEETNRAIRMVGLDLIGTSLVEMGFAADAIPLFREAQILSERMDTSVAPVLFPQLPELPRQIEEHVNAAIDDMSPAELAAIAGREIAKAAAGPDRAKSVADFIRHRERARRARAGPDDDRAPPQPRPGIGTQPGCRFARGKHHHRALRARSAD